MKVGLILPLFSGDPARVAAAAREAEDFGFDGVFAFDHFFPLGGHSRGPSLEAFTTLAAVASVTSRVRIGTLVTRAILRPVGLVAKMASTLHLISGGRMILGIGTGDAANRVEHRTFGFPDPGASERREGLEETLRALRALFGGKAFAGGERLPPIAGPLLPRSPAGGPPIWVGGTSDAMVRLAAELGEGWNGWSLEPRDFEARVGLLSVESTRLGRSVEATWGGLVLAGEDEAEVESLLADRRARGLTEPLAWSGPADRLTEHALALSAAGASWVILMLAGPGGRRRLVAERVLPRL